MTKKTLDLLESLLVNRQMTSDELDALITGRIPEDQHLDYKDGRELNDKRKAGRTLRQYLSGFANSEGGVLVIGVNDKKWQVTGCPAPGGSDLETWGGDLAEWAASCVMPIASLFSQRPAFCVVDHPQGKVLVAWTARSLTFVHCNQGGEWVYYLRFHDKTLRAPDYLVSDLVLGRRQHPHLAITHCELGSLRLDHRFERLKLDETDLAFHVTFSIENQSLAWTEGLRLGMIGWDKEHTTSLSGHLLSHIELVVPEVRGVFVKRHPFHNSGTTSLGASIPPFTVETISMSAHCFLPIRRYQDWCIPYRWKAAVYLLSVNSPPIWYQMSLRVDQGLRQLAEDRGSLNSDIELLEIRRVSGERPVVACVPEPSGKDA